MTSVQTVKFQDDTVSALGFGSMGLSIGYGIPDPKDTQVVLGMILKNGVSFVDTADVYGCGHNEELWAPVLKEHRDKIFLCTKYGFKFDFSGIRGDPEYIRECCEASLKRLGISQIDLYYQHRVDLHTPIEVSVKTMEELRLEGKVKYLGLSECSAESLKKALTVAKIHAIEWEYSLLATDIETNGIMDLCREHNITLVAYSPLARGLFGVDWKSPDDIPQDDFRKQLPRYTEGWPLVSKLISTVKELAVKKGCTPNQIALNWVRYQSKKFGVQIIPIPGTKTPKYLQENIDAVAVDFTEEDDLALRKLIDNAEWQHLDRYPKAMMANLAV